MRFGRTPRRNPTLRGVDLFHPELFTTALKQLIVIGSVELTAKNASATEKWQIGYAERWSADLAKGTMQFHFADHAIIGPVQFLGSYSARSETWLWGWANSDMPSHVTTASLATKVHGDVHGIAALSERKLNLEKTWLADDLASITVEIAELSGMYRAPSFNGYTYLGFSDFRRLE